MNSFSFTSTAQCDTCGAYLSESDEECNHGGMSVDTHIFRRVGEGRDSITGVESTIRYKWDSLEEKVDDEWIAYEWLGTRQHVVNLLNSSSWDSVEDLPQGEMALDRPID